MYIQLFRPSDNAISEAVEFFYKPNPNLGSPGRKRPRSGSICSLSEVPSVLSDESILHATVPDVQAQYNYEDNEIKQIMNTWNEVGKYAFKADELQRNYLRISTFDITFRLG